MEEHIIDLETQLAHANKTIEDLSAVLYDHAKRLEQAEKRIQLLLERAAEEEARANRDIPNQKPPHW